MSGRGRPKKFAEPPAKATTDIIDVTGETPGAQETVEAPVTPETPETPEAPATPERPSADSAEQSVRQILEGVRLQTLRNRNELPAVVRVRRGNQYYYLTLPQVPNKALRDCLDLTRGVMSGERCVAYIAAVLNIPPPRLYTSYDFIIGE